MAELNVFKGDAFGVISLTAAINQTPEGQRSPDALDMLFEEEGITTTAVFIERDNDGLALVPAAERGAPADVTTGSQRDKIPFQTIHLPTRAVIRADEVQGIRAFGSETELEGVQTLVDKRLMKMQARLTATNRFHRASLLGGKIFDANGTRVLLDIHARFGITQDSVAFALATAGTKVQNKIKDAKRKAEDVIGDSGIITGWVGFCGRNWFDAFTAHQVTEKAFDRYNDGQFLRDDPRMDGFRFQDVLWKEFYGKVGDINFIDPDIAYLVPIVQGLFITNYAPADYMETVNTTGVPFYASQELMRHNKGVDMEAQSNPLNLCTKPKAVIKLTL